ncbi:MAG TPA: cytochrome c [Rhizomicrobium sp.]|jgi:mono/diheme cytochrome c family protein
MALLLAPSAPALAASTWDGIYTDAQAARGAERYKAACAMCHGPALEGNGEAPPLVGRFMPDWEGTNLSDLYDKVHDTMPLFAPGMLKPEDTSDMLAFILQANGFPSGAAPLATGDVLKTISFDVAKPVVRTMRTH